MLSARQQAKAWAIVKKVSTWTRCVAGKNAFANTPLTTTNTWRDVEKSTNPTIKMKGLEGARNIIRAPKNEIP